MTPSRVTTRWLAFAGLILLLAGFTFLGFLIDFRDWLTPSRLQSWLERMGPLAPLAFIGLMATAVVVSPVPSLPLDLAAGATFGPVLGTIYAVLGAEIGAVVSFLIGRALGRELVSRLLRRDIAFCEKCSDHHLVILVLLSRLVPVFSFDVVSYGAGLTNMSLAAFALATLAGMIPPTFALVYLGDRIISAEWPLVAAGAMMVAAFLLAPRLAVRYPSAWWSRVLLLTDPSFRRAGADAAPPSAPSSAGRCAGCGAPLS